MDAWQLVSPTTLYLTKVACLTPTRGRLSPCSRIAQARLRRAGKALQMQKWLACMTRTGTHGFSRLQLRASSPASFPERTSQLLGSDAPRRGGLGKRVQPFNYKNFSISCVAPRTPSLLKSPDSQTQCSLSHIVCFRRSLRPNRIFGAPWLTLIAQALWESR